MKAISNGNGHSNGTSLVWPEGKKFAFTIIDDTDRATIENVKPVYDFLAELGFRTTKTVWPLSPEGKPIQGGQSLEDEDYQNWILDLKTRGFEIGLHGVSDEPSTRGRIIEGHRRFESIIGHAPAIHANHTGQTECIYWGEDRFDGLTKKLYRFSRRYLSGGTSNYYGHIKDSEYFWGDLCQQNIRFVRNLIFDEINTLKSDPLMPYHDPLRPYVQFWFSSSGGKNVEKFCELISERNQDELMAAGGASIIYTHFGMRFFADGRLNQRFVRLMRRLAALPGWFVPTSTLLNYVGKQRGWINVGDHRKTLAGMQRQWFLQKIRRGKE